MSRFHVTNESTEDTFASTDNLQEAIRVAREVARQGATGDPVCVESEGRAVKQFMLMPNGTVAEQAVIEPEEQRSAKTGKLRRA